MAKLFKGIIPAMPTPFDKNGEIWEDQLRKLVNYLLESGVHGLYPCGSIGECYSLSTEEIKRVTEIVIEEVGGKVPVLAGTGASGTKQAIERTRNAGDIGADGAFIVPPYYVNTNQEGIKKHFHKIAESTDLPILYYHVPQFTHQDLSVDTIKRLDEEHENFVGIKDSSGDIRNVGSIVNETSDKFIFFQGIDPLLLPSLIMGCDGGVSGTANIEPSYALEVYKKYEEGDIIGAREVQINKINPLWEACFLGHFPEGFKEASRKTGLDLGYSRLPAYSLSDAEKKKQEKLLEELGLTGEKT